MGSWRAAGPERARSGHTSFFFPSDTLALGAGGKPGMSVCAHHRVRAPGGLFGSTPTLFCSLAAQPPFIIHWLGGAGPQTARGLGSERISEAAQCDAGTVDTQCVSDARVCSEDLPL